MKERRPAAKASGIFASIRFASPQASKRASSSSTLRSSSGSSGPRPLPDGSVGTASSRARLQRRASTASAAPPRPRPAKGNSQARRLKPCFGGAASTLSPNWSTSLDLISLFVSPAAIRARMNERMRSAIGELDTARDSWHVGQISSRSSSGRVGFCSLAATVPAAPRAREARPCARLSSGPPEGDSVVPVELFGRHGPLDVLADETPVPVAEPRLRKSAQAVASPRPVVLVTQGGVGELVSLDEAPRVAAQILEVDSDDDHVLVAPFLPRGLERGCLVLARRAPGGPEVDDDRLSAQVCQ